MKINLSFRQWIYLIVGILFALYCLFQARFLILGPQVWIYSPQDGGVVAEPAVTLEGQARNAAWISLNDRPIFTDEEGLWSEKLIVSSGVSIMTVKVRDRFGREKQKSIRIILN